MAEQNNENLPIDRGWAFVVLIAVMVTTFLEGGLYKSFGVFFVEYVEKFGSSASVTSLISGLYCGVYSFTSLPLMAFGLKKISCRVAVVIGGFFLFIGYLLSSLANSIEVLFIAQSFCTGVGSAFVHGPSLVVLGRYFERRRGMTSGISMACSSFGGLVLPLVFRSLVLEYSLEGALLITSGLVFHICIAGLFLRPLESYAIRKKIKIEKEEIESMLHGDLNGQEMIFHDSKRTDGSRQYSSVNSINSSHRQKQLTQTRRFSSLNTLSVPTTRLNSSSVEHYSRSLGFDINLITYSSADLHIKEHSSQTDDHDLASSKGILSRLHDHIASLKQICEAAFLPLIIAVAFGQIACGIGHVFISPYAKDQGIPKSDIPILVAIIGAGNLFGRIVIGLIADMKYVRKYLLISVGLLCTGIPMFFVTFVSSFVDFVVYCVVHGLFSGSLTALYAPVCIEIIGLDNFNKGMGILTSGQGLVIGISAPFLGLIKDATGSYVLTFYVMGTTSILAALSLMCVPCAKRYTIRKQTKAQGQNQV